MSKLSLAGASLAAAIPGGFLAFLMFTHLSKFGEMPMLLLIAASLALAVAAVAVLLPPGILILGPKGVGAAKPKKAKEEDPEKTKAMPADESFEEESLDETAAAEMFEADDETEAMASDESLETTDFDDSAFDDFDDEPKKR